MPDYVAVPRGSTAVQSRFFDVGAVRLHAVEAGDGPLVVLLHGFPEFWYSWRHQIPALAAAGLRVVAPDLRGCNLSDKPRGLAAYRVRELAADVAGLIAACGEEQAAVVGHDWGGTVAWALAIRHPERVERLVIVNSPHPLRFLAAVRQPAQLARSWYMLLFQLPWLPEALLRMRRFAGLRRTLRRAAAHAGTFTDEDLDRYGEAFAQPGALTAAINYYRAMRLRQRRDVPGGMPAVEAPVLVVWGDRDHVLGPELADPGPRYAPNRRVEHLPHAAHFAHQDDHERVNALLVEFLHE
jgi:epoxide hydrolase 4